MGETYVTDEARMEAVKHLFELVLEINSLESRTSVDDKPTAMCYFYGHVSIVEIYVHIHGWKSDSSSDYSFEMYVDKDCFDLEKYKQISKKLEDIRDGICSR